MPAFAQEATPQSTPHSAVEQKRLAENASHQLEAIRYTENPDYSFAMQIHELLQGEISVANYQVAHGTDPEIRAAAKRMVELRTKKRERIDGWLEHFRKFD